jgi:hypothetical protein
MQSQEWEALSTDALPYFLYSEFRIERFEKPVSRASRASRPWFSYRKTAIGETPMILFQIAHSEFFIFQ